MIVLLDAGPLGMVTNPLATPQNVQCQQWAATLLVSGVRVLVPDIADYEVRRELLRANRMIGIAHLDQAKITMGHLPITTEAMLKAAEFWAQARKQGRPTTVDAALDGDVILAARAVILAAQEADRVVIATTNLAHLSRFADADLWQNIHPRRRNRGRPEAGATLYRRRVSSCHRVSVSACQRVSLSPWSPCSLQS